VRGPYCVQLEESHVCGVAIEGGSIGHRTLPFCKKRGASRSWRFRRPLVATGILSRDLHR
jgi:hypothetical protein